MRLVARPGQRGRAGARPPGAARRAPRAGRSDAPATEEREARGERDGRAATGRREHDDEARPHLELHGLDRLLLALPGERGDPRLALVRRPRLVLEQRDQAPPAAGKLKVQHRAHEAPAAHAEPAARDLEPVARRPLEALDFEVDARERRTLRCVLGGHDLRPVRVPPGPDAGVALAAALHRMLEAKRGLGCAASKVSPSSMPKSFRRPLPRRRLTMNSTLPARGAYVLRPHGKLDAAAAAALMAMVGGELAREEPRTIVLDMRAVTCSRRAASRR